MPKMECLTVRRNAILLADCILTDGTHQILCCSCPNREIKVCALIAEGKPPCQDCWR